MWIYGALVFCATSFSTGCPHLKQNNIQTPTEGNPRSEETSFLYMRGFFMFLPCQFHMLTCNLYVFCYVKDYPSGFKIPSKAYSLFSC